MSPQRQWELAQFVENLLRKSAAASVPAVEPSKMATDVRIDEQEGSAGESTKKKMKEVWQECSSREIQRRKDRDGDDEVANENVENPDDTMFNLGDEVLSLSLEECGW